jgi:translocation and assembly module TamA
VTLQPTGEAPLDAALSGSSTLISLRESAPVGGFALAERARQDSARVESALHSFGYYKAKVTITIAGHALDDPSLPATIDSAPANPPLKVDAAFDLGPRFTLGNVTITGTVPPDVPGHLRLKPGDPAESAPILAAQARLLDALKQDGYPLAKVPTPVAVLHPDVNQLDVEFQPDSGPHADIGPITIDGLKDMHEAFVRKRLLLHQGEPFSPSAIEKACADLAGLGPFASVRAEPADALDPEGQLPVTFDLTERPLHAVDVGVAYSTDLGVNANVGWHDRNLFGNAEQLNLTAGNQLGGNAVTKPGYNAGAQFIKPDFLARDQQLEIDLNAVKQSLQAYDQTALLEKAALNRKLSPRWTVSLGLSAEQESIIQEGVTRHYNLVGIPAQVRYDSTNSLMDATSGIRATLSVTPTESLGSTSSTFFISQVSGSTYLDLSGGGRGVLALRGLIGQVSGGGVFALPPDQRFYAGGGGTVRGYRFQSVGPAFADGTPAGGTTVQVGSVEWRQRFGESYGAVLFVDGGEVTGGSTSLSGSGVLRVGAGAGFRYYTAFGPIRIDVAAPLTKSGTIKTDIVEAYIGIGQAF